VKARVVVVVLGVVALVVFDIIGSASVREAVRAAMLAMLIWRFEKR